MIINFPLLAFIYTAAGFYFCLVFLAQRAWRRRNLKGSEDKLDTVRKKCEQTKSQLREADEQSQKLNEQADRIFALYDLTKEITRNFNQEDAFKIFQKRLQKEIAGLTCRVFPAESEELDGLKQVPGWQFLPLNAHRKFLGVLAFQGCLGDELEKVAVLGQQYALARQRISLYQEVEKLAITDALTGVFTRRYVLERFEEEHKRAQKRKLSVAFIMIDIDFFKSFNDKHGHLAGDLILKQVASRIKENIREIDFVGRYGGEEFAVVLPETTSDKAFIVGERIRQAVATGTIKAYDAEIQLTVSVGIASYPANGRTAAEIIEVADQSLYQAKKAGRNRCVTA